jgi:hypothetical protein
MPPAILTRNIASARMVGRQGSKASALKDAALSIRDALCINVVLPDNAYSEAATIIKERLIAQSSTSQGAKILSVLNCWKVPVRLTSNGLRGGLGLKINMSFDGDNNTPLFTQKDGYPLVVMIHTVQSLAGMVRLDEAFSQISEATSTQDRSFSIKDTRAIASGTLEHVIIYITS